MNIFLNFFDDTPELIYIPIYTMVGGDSVLNRDTALQAAREHLEVPVWGLLSQLEATLADLAKVRHVNLSDPRAIGSVLNSALSDAAVAAKISDHGLEVAYCENGQSNKLTGHLTIEGKKYSVSLELHLAGPRGGTSKKAHQFAAYDIEGEPTFPGFEIEAPSDLLFFVACHLSGTGASISSAFIKFADKIDQRKIEIHRDIPPMTAGIAETGPVDGPSGTKMTLKKPKGEESGNGSKTDKRGDAASSS